MLTLINDKFAPISNNKGHTRVFLRRQPLQAIETPTRRRLDASTAEEVAPTSVVSCERLGVMDT